MVFQEFLIAFLGGLLGACVPLLLFYRFRGRIIRSGIKTVQKMAPKEVEELVLGIFTTWEDKKDEKGELVRHFKPSPWLIGFLSSVMPIAVEIGWAAFGHRLSGLPLGVGPDGQPKLNFLAGPMKKMMAGKKISFEDFVPEIMNRALPYIEKFAEKLTGGIQGALGAGQAPGSSSASPPSRPPSGGFNPG